MLFKVSETCTLAWVEIAVPQCEKKFVVLTTSQSENLKKALERTIHFVHEDSARGHKVCRKYIITSNHVMQKSNPMFDLTKLSILQ